MLRRIPITDAGEKNKVSDEEKSLPTASIANVVGDSGDQVDSYKLLSVLGEGTLAVVYLAKHQGPVKRRLTLKVIKSPKHPLLVQSKRAFVLAARHKNS
jgi:serine/threonine protein kinase